MKPRWRNLGLGTVLVLASLPGCGFEPLYGQRAGGDSLTDRLSLVAIAPIPERVGQVLYNDLLDRISPFGPRDQAPYRLQVRLEFDREGLGFEPDEAITRVNLRLGAEYRLVDVESGKTVFGDVARSTVSYNVVQSDFANLNAERNAERNAVRMVSEEITERVGIFLGRRGDDEDEND